jgi:hypothetical protein
MKKKKLSSNENKELSSLVESKIMNKSLQVENRLIEIRKDLENQLKKGEKRYKKLMVEIDKKYPPKTPKRGSFDGISSIVFDTAFELYFIGNNSALIIELQGLLERFCLNALFDLLPINSDAKEVITDGFSKKTLKDVATYFKTFKLWDESDVKFALKLTQIRNGIAHKNTSIVSKYLGNGKQNHPESIHQITSKIDSIPYILTTMDLIIKASQAAKPSFLNNPRLKARYDTYLNLIGNLTNMYCLPEIIHMPFHIKDMFFNNQFSKTYLIGSQKLTTELQKVKPDIIAFHEHLGVDDGKANEIYTRLSKNIENIYKYMKEDLSIDSSTDFFKEPSILDIKEILREKNKN